MVDRPLFAGVLMVALTCMTIPAQAQEFGDSSSDDESSSMSSDSDSSFSDSSDDESSSYSSTSSSESRGSGSSAASAGGDNSLESGTGSLAFSVPGGGNPYADGTAGIWYMVTDNINLGLNLGFGIDSTRTINNYGTDDQTSTRQTGFDLLLAPAMRYYLIRAGKVTPYILGQINFHKFFDGDNETSADPDDDNFNPDLQPELALVGGFGLEWFPIQQFSVGGHVGMGFDLLRQDQVNGGTLVRNGVRIGTFTSALTANLYFF